MHHLVLLIEDLRQKGISFKDKATIFL